MLKAENIIYSFSDTKVADGISFTFLPGKIYGILGSDEFQIISILKIFGGIEKPDSGTIYINQNDIYSSFNLSNDNLRSSLSYVFSSGGLLSNLTIKENLFLPLNFFFPKTAYKNKMEKIIYWMNVFKVSEEVLDLRPANIPLRVAKLILFVRAYVTSPGIIIYDEPFQNLNYRDKEIVNKNISSFRKEEKVTQIIKSNSDNSILTNSDFILIIDEGKIIESGKPEKLKESGNRKTIQILEYYS